jgi:hypothetical protein
MVDYNNENTLAVPSIDINRIQILERRAYVIEALEQYYKYRMSGAKHNTQYFISRLASLFWELQETLKRKYQNDKEMNYNTMYEILFPENKSANMRDCIKVWTKINLLLGEINLTKIDTRKEYDTTDIEEENKVQNL